ncbi:MAG: (2Fe-2S) ferredoxin domain-containing protein [Bacillota bacterium]
MHSIAVCVGSSCHLKGAYDVLNCFKRLITEKSLESQVELKACFCLGKCRDGVSVLFDGQLVTGVTRDTAADFFGEYISPAEGDLPAADR